MLTQRVSPPARPEGDDLNRTVGPDAAAVPTTAAKTTAAMNPTILEWDMETVWPGIHAAGRDVTAGECASFKAFLSGGAAATKGGRTGNPEAARDYVARYCH